MFKMICLWHCCQRGRKIINLIIIRSSQGERLKIGRNIEKLSSSQRAIKRFLSKRQRVLLIRGEHKRDEGDREKYKKEEEILIYLVRGRYKKELRGSHKDFCNLIRRWKLLIKGEIMIQVFFLVLSYYLNLVWLNKVFQHLGDLVDQFGFP